MIIHDNETNLAWDSEKDLVLHNFLPDKPKYYGDIRDHQEIWNRYMFSMDAYGSAMDQPNVPFPVMCGHILREIPLDVKIWNSLTAEQKQDPNVKNTERGLNHLAMVRRVHDVVDTMIKDQGIEPLINANRESFKPGDQSDVEITIDPSKIEQLFCREYSGLPVYTLEDLRKLNAQMEQVLRARGYVRTKFGQRLRHKGMDQDILARVLRCSIDGYIQTSCYDLSMILGRFHGYARVRNGRIMACIGPDKDQINVVIEAISDIIASRGEHIKTKIDQSGISIKTKDR